MRLVTALVVLGLAGGAWSQWGHHLRGGTDAEPAQADGRPFDRVPGQLGPLAEGVHVLAPGNCTPKQKERADALVARLQAAGVPVQRHTGMSVRFEGEDHQQQVERYRQLIDRPPPLVLVNGRIKSNPADDEVLAEVRRGG